MHKLTSQYYIDVDNGSNCTLRECTTGNVIRRGTLGDCQTYAKRFKLDVRTKNSGDK